MIFMGLLMFTGRMNAVTGYLSRFQTQSSVQGSKEPGEGGDKTPAMTAGTEPESADSESGAETEATEAETGKTDAANPAEAGTRPLHREADKANAPEETAGDGKKGQTRPKQEHRKCFRPLILPLRTSTAIHIPRQITRERPYS